MNANSAGFYLGQFAGRYSRPSGSWLLQHQLRNFSKFHVRDWCGALPAKDADGDRNGSGGANDNKRQSGAFALVLIQPIRKQQADSNAQCYASAGDQQKIR
jgi:hypothetical protein